jgi:hypothetical protein
VIHGTVVGTLHVRGADAGPVKSALAGLRLTPEGLNRDAVLVLRNLADPLPGRLGADRFGAGPASVAWERAAVAALSVIRREAAHPVDGPVPAGAQAVLFEDWSQLLAALARDWLAGTLTQHWWWREFVRRAPTQAAVLSAWRANARAAPAALKILAGHGLAVRFALALPAASASALAGDIAANWGAPVALTGAIAAASAEPHPEPQRGDPPWAAWVPEAETAPPGARLLLGLGLALARAPATATRSMFWDAVTATLGQSGEGRAHQPAEASAQHPAVLRSEGRRGAAGSDVRASHQASTDPDPARGPIQQPTAPSPASGRPPGTASPRDDAVTASGAGWTDRLRTESSVRATRPNRGQTTDRGGVSRAAAGSGRPEGRQESPGARAPAAVRGHRAQANPSVQPPAAGRGTGTEGDQGLAPQDVIRVHTELGGLFFLLNVALADGLYGDFTRAATPGIPLSPWDLLALAGPQLLARPAADDPVWDLLSALAGRDESGPPRVPRAMRRWVRRVTDRWRVQLALALDCPPPDAGSLLLQLAAVIDATPSRVDAEFDLSGLPIAVRLAGLDRDPGWIPATGRTVLFHFH